MSLVGEVIKLKGKTLKTLDRGHSFDILDLREKRILVRLHSTDNVRPIPYKDVEGSFNDLELRGEISLVEIKQKYSTIHPTYVAAILASLPNVEYRLRPIRLRMKERK